MGITELIIIGIGLAMDAFAVSIGKGLALRGIEWKHILLAGLWLGGFQAMMPLIGYVLGVGFSDMVSRLDHWIAFALLFIIGSKMLVDSIKGGEEQGNGDFGIKTMFILAVATSIDALAVGVSLAFVGANIWLAVAIIGVVTFILSGIGVEIGAIVGSRWQRGAGIVGGVTLVAIGIKILVEHSITH